MTHRFDRFGNLVRLYNPQRGVMAVRAESPGEWQGMNDPRFTAVGSFGCHLYRPPRDGESELWMHSRHVETLREAPWGVTGWYGDNPKCPTLVTLGERLPLLRVFRHWKIEPPIYRCEGRVEVLGSAAGWFIKEPKVGVGSFIDLADRLTVTDKDGKGLTGWLAKGVYGGPTYDITSLTDPQKRTAQITDKRRRRFVLRGPNGRVFVTLQDEFGKWRVRSDGREDPSAKGRGDDYCHCDKLRGSWELIRRPHVASVLDCAWNGGTGFSDCLCGYRALVPGETYRWWLRVRVGK